MRKSTICEAFLDYAFTIGNSSTGFPTLLDLCIGSVKASIRFMDKIMREFLPPAESSSYILSSPYLPASRQTVYRRPGCQSCKLLGNTFQGNRWSRTSNSLLGQMFVETWEESLRHSKEERKELLAIVKAIKHFHHYL